MSDEITDNMIDSYWMTVAKTLHKENVHLIDELEKLLKWKKEATAVMEEVQAEWEAAGKPGVMGQSHARNMATQIEMLRDESAYWQNSYHACNDEYNKLRSRVTKWADAEAKYREREYMEDLPAFESAATALRKAVGR
jgi:predicted nuclease with TOPRIM domain